MDTYSLLSNSQYNIKFEHCKKPTMIYHDNYTMVGEAYIYYGKSCHFYYLIMCTNINIQCH